MHLLQDELPGVVTQVGQTCWHACEHSCVKSSTCEPQM